ncbi:hypothetical protein DERP_014553 [Dermatophagoides pteronyssinus]|uniref:Uncharacterized protein n=1 Tax=Dermatophagoides pteronyssinus TaxID=6956 RepID=A0ABQ8J1W3_DERPT|nr:hypothetical protein DERP_014553 [Dermatophagoides pteronyssinus]
MISHKSFIECHERCYDNAAEEGFTIMKFSCLSFNQLFRSKIFMNLLTQIKPYFGNVDEMIDLNHHHWNHSFDEPFLIIKFSIQLYY